LVTFLTEFVEETGCEASRGMLCFLFNIFLSLFSCLFVEEACRKTSRETSQEACCEEARCQTCRCMFSFPFSFAVVLSCRVVETCCEAQGETRSKACGEACSKARCEKARCKTCRETCCEEARCETCRCMFSFPFSFAVIFSGRVVETCCETQGETRNKASGEAGSKARCEEARREARCQARRCMLSFPFLLLWFSHAEL
jgi:hypothetical protein